MKRNRDTEEQIIGILKSQKVGAKVTDLVRQHRISKQSFYHWNSRFDGMCSGQVGEPMCVEAFIS